jgi:hypothetical protein
MISIYLAGKSRVSRRRSKQRKNYQRQCCPSQRKFKRMLKPQKRRISISTMPLQDQERTPISTPTVRNSLEAREENSKRYSTAKLRGFKDRKRNFKKLPSLMMKQVKKRP